MSPLRISFMGGRTDFPSFFAKEEGFVVSTTIDKYIHLKVRRTEDRVLFQQHELEDVAFTKDVKNPLVREVLKVFTMQKGIEIRAHCETPSGTGLGSSSSFTVGLLKAVSECLGQNMSPKDLAERASQIEIENLNINTGKQDQYAAAFGGLNAYRFHKDKAVEVLPISLSSENLASFESSICIYYTGIQRDGARILEKERAKNNASMASLVAMRDLAMQFYKELRAGGDLKNLGEILDLGWKQKQTLNTSISNSFIDDSYQAALRAGAYGGKLLGAGGGGFLLFICPKENQQKLQKSLSHLKPLSIKFSTEGVRIIKE